MSQSSLAKWVAYTIARIRTFIIKLFEVCLQMNKENSTETLRAQKNKKKDKKLFAKYFEVGLQLSSF